MEHALMIKAQKAASKGQKYAFATVIEASLKGTPQKSGAKMLVSQDGSIEGTIGGGRYEKAATAECLKTLKTGKPKLVQYDYFGQKGQSVCGGFIKVFIEPCQVHQQDFIICGAGHIALPLSAIGKMLNLKVTVIDNRKSYANKKRFPHVDQIICGNHAQKLAQFKINKDALIMIVTQGNEYDFQCLKTALKSKAQYIGVISSKAKKVKFFNRLKALNYKPKDLQRVKIPAGVDLGGQKPEEIAVSIAAEIVTTMNKDKVGTDKFKIKSS